ncbi:DNA-directed RNA polymerase subunit P [Candidatus Bathyarchaeota archaeon]|nr:DNA-directed RNA polymerase subunit P [Candidatus Bathyarchaeota archaeon]MBS7613716.1 DNA-directed RNA polymerase subunit P [Candidatus Bathyarchaeota archaeon]MBS7617742.1 DNA-directed RNA polymerase subunit P [Candidatus Bathyarchaeota archaeon]
MASGEILYKCFKCGALIPYGRLKVSPDLKCPECGCKILTKIRPSVVKKIKAI